ncbi:sugar ABC transporter substrate-binding protein [Streptomyces griseus]|uniref:sugar ABC transporter substrate-binding protein n=1 Tax=Streptomyces griseus TaxID=1911 RepID=UPI00056128D9|nr:sugar ABC transporter substrate-binding protein [Streptomyces griseus]
MKLARTRSTAAAVTVVLAAMSLATACNRSGSDSTSAGSSAPAIGIDLPRSDSDFWNSYAQYLKAGIKSDGINALPVSNSQNDVTKLVANVQVFENTGAKAVVMAPQDTGAIASTLDALAAGKGKVAEFQGALDSINGRDRSEAFAQCMKTKFPKIKVFELPTDWKGDVASAKLQSLLAQHPDLNGIYMQAGGVFLQPTLALLEQKKLLKPAGEKGHISIVSNDGIPQEFDAIRKGQIDATISQPADLYAKYALYYAQAAAQGKTFKPGPTDHDSTIIQLPNGLEDQLPAPLVTKDNVDDKSLWGNNIG